MSAAASADALLRLGNKLDFGLSINKDKLGNGASENYFLVSNSCI